MIIIHTADVHIGPCSKNIFYDWYMLALYKFRDRIKEIVAEYRNKYPKEQILLIIAGDTFKTSWPSKSDFLAMYHMYIQLRAVVDDMIVTVGNHDIDGNGVLYENWHTLSPLRSADIKVPWMQHQVISACGYNFGAVNYIPRTDFDREEIGKTINMSHITIMHGAVDGCKLSNTYTLAKPSMKLNSDFFEEFTPETGAVLMGDIHRPQSLSRGNCNVMYPGSPVPLDYGEVKHKHGVLIHRVIDGDITTDFNELQIIKGTIYEHPTVIDSQEELNRLVGSDIYGDMEDFKWACPLIRFTPSSAFMKAVDFNEARKRISNSPLAEYPVRVNFEFVTQQNAEPSAQVVIDYGGSQMDIPKDLEIYCNKHNMEYPEMLNRHHEFEEQLQNA